jgi:hypothetical protein
MSDPAPRGFARLGFDWLDRGIRDRAARPGFPGWAGLGFDIRPGPGWVRLIGFNTPRKTIDPWYAARIGPARPGAADL